MDAMYNNSNRTNVLSVSTFIIVRGNSALLCPPTPHMTWTFYWLLSLDRNQNIVKRPSNLIRQTASIC